MGTASRRCTDVPAVNHLFTDKKAQVLAVGEAMELQRTEKVNSELH